MLDALADAQLVCALARVQDPATPEPWCAPPMRPVPVRWSSPRAALDPFNPKAVRCRRVPLPPPPCWRWLFSSWRRCPSSARGGRLRAGHRGRARRRRPAAFRGAARAPSTACGWRTPRCGCSATRHGSLGRRTGPRGPGSGRAPCTGRAESLNVAPPRPCASTRREGAAAPRQAASSRRGTEPRDRRGPPDAWSGPLSWTRRRRPPARSRPSARTPESCAGGREFPGGKQEPGGGRSRRPAAGVSPGARAYLGLPSEAEPPEPHGWPLTGTAVMRVFTAVLRGSRGLRPADAPDLGTPCRPERVLQERVRNGEDHLDVRWLPLDDSAAVLALPWIPADLPIVAALLESAGNGARMSHTTAERRDGTDFWRGAPVGPGARLLHDPGGRPRSSPPPSRPSPQAGTHISGAGSRAMLLAYAAAPLAITGRLARLGPRTVYLWGLATSRGVPAAGLREDTTGPRWPAWCRAACRCPRRP
ncbi:hypothetical protein QJS66_06375 [Kocuria rhizophila]|nr:hypothetical protein QJS66_06375 [Kocuria rhizophila]